MVKCRVYRLQGLHSRAVDKGLSQPRSIVQRCTLTHDMQMIAVAVRLLSRHLSVVQAAGATLEGCC